MPAANVNPTCPDSLCLFRPHACFESCCSHAVVLLHLLMPLAVTQGLMHQGFVFVAAASIAGGSNPRDSLAHLLSKLPPFCIAGGSCHAVLQEAQLAQLFIKALPPFAQHRVDQGGSHKHGCRATSIGGGVGHQVSRYLNHHRLFLSRFCYFCCSTGCWYQVQAC